MLKYLHEKPLHHHLRWRLPCSLVSCRILARAVCRAGSETGPAAVPFHSYFFLTWVTHCQWASGWVSGTSDPVCLFTVYFSSSVLLHSNSQWQIKHKFSVLNNNAPSPSVSCWISVQFLQASCSLVSHYSLESKISIGGRTVPVWT